MGEVSKKDKTHTRSWSDGLKAEFRKIIWPDQKDLAKQTAAVITVSVALGAIIAVVDAIMQYGIDFLIK
ncbi:MAG: preprotein translocase subunit SecE [Eubacteriales bacterium]|nr:preprotein translocase subunit SecE [Eubacteriales bacterium]